MGILKDNRHLEEADKKYIWHPFTQMKDWLSETPIIISEGRDCFLKDIYGRWYLDGVSSLWVNIHGHRKKELNDAIKEQVEKIAHTTLLGLSNVPAIKLAERLIRVVDAGLGTGLSKVFYSDNGSTAIEVALKMAFQYWKHKGIRGKHSFLSLKNAYHGDTLGAVSVGGIDIFHEEFKPLLFKTFKATSPYCYRCEFELAYPGCKLRCLKAMEEILKRHSKNIAGLIIEPMVQSAGGIIVLPHGYLKGVKKLCTKYKVLMLADEVATGFGRTGKFFACENERVSPDIICLSKGITGGYLPLAVTVATEKIFNAFLGEYKELKTFFHGHSYTGNPIACAVALACLEVFEKEKTIKNLKPKIEVLEGWLKSISLFKHVGDARGKGLMAGVELVKDKGTKEPYAIEEKIGWKVAWSSREKGVLIRPLGNVIVIMPPLSISLENLREMLNIIEDSIASVTD
ncbi:MAG: adenosylmethionine--8-amino-7-oxononanoate transaminase [Nitrospirae bacterium]|nr:adenosylmethionine--8-amino-7-oxononanoate transaminase [Nitrospirota bacterium]